MTPQLSTTCALLLVFSCTWPLELVFEQFKQSMLKHLGEKERKKREKKSSLITQRIACPKSENYLLWGTYLPAFFPSHLISLVEIFVSFSFPYQIRKMAFCLPTQNVSQIPASDVFFFFYHWKYKHCTSTLWKWMWNSVIHSWNNKISHICTELNGFS